MTQGIAQRVTARSIRIAALALLPLVLAAASAAAQSPASTDSTLSVADGAYTADQAAAGQATFGNTCGNCHGTAEFSGPAFRRIWSGRRVYDLFDQLRNTMPLDNPGGLTREQYAGVIAYVLKLNQYPVGDAALPVTDEGLRRVVFQ